MNRKARKIKIRIRKGRWFIFILPALNFKFLKRVCKLGIKFSTKRREHTRKHDTEWRSDKEHFRRKYHENDKSIGKDFRGNDFDMGEVDLEELIQDLDLFFDELAKFEPFVLVEVSEESENVYVKIETV